MVRMNQTNSNLDLAGYRDPVQSDYVTNMVQGWQVMLLCRERQHLHAIRELWICCCRRVYEPEVAHHICLQVSVV